jgi:alpha-beta hydrolase superfamily lysophospholipase
MVLKGQFLERPTIIPVGQCALEGLSHRGSRSPALLILPPPPSEGGAMDHVLAAELAWAASQAGHATLRFNFRGVGASQGARGVLEDWVRDAAAARETLELNVGGQLVAVASIGGSAEVLLALAGSAKLRGGALIAPGEVAGDALERVGVPLVVIWGAWDGRPVERGPPAALVQAGVRVSWIESLPGVGKAVVDWLNGL